MSFRHVTKIHQCLIAEKCLRTAILEDGAAGSIILEKQEQSYSFLFCQTALLNFYWVDEILGNRKNCNSDVRENKEANTKWQWLRRQWGGHFQEASGKHVGGGH